MKNLNGIIPINKLNIGVHTKEVSAIRDGLSELKNTSTNFGNEATEIQEKAKKELEDKVKNDLEKKKKELEEKTKKDLEKKMANIIPKNFNLDKFKNGVNNNNNKKKISKKDLKIQIIMGILHQVVPEGNILDNILKPATETILKTFKSNPAIRSMDLFIDHEIFKFISHKYRMIFDKIINNINININENDYKNENTNNLKLKEFFKDYILNVMNPYEDIFENKKIHGELLMEIENPLDPTKENSRIKEINEKESEDEKEYIIIKNFDEYMFFEFCRTFSNNIYNQFTNDFLINDIIYNNTNRILNIENATVKGGNNGGKQDIHLNEIESDIQENTDKTQELDKTPKETERGEEKTEGDTITSSLLPVLSTLPQTDNTNENISNSIEDIIINSLDVISILNDTMNSDKAKLVKKIKSFFSGFTYNASYYFAEDLKKNLTDIFPNNEMIKLMTSFQSNIGIFLSKIEQNSQIINEYNKGFAEGLKKKEDETTNEKRKIEDEERKIIFLKQFIPEFYSSYDPEKITFEEITEEVLITSQPSLKDNNYIYDIETLDNVFTEHELMHKITRMFFSNYCAAMYKVKFEIIKENDIKYKENIMKYVFNKLNEVLINYIFIVNLWNSSDIQIMIADIEKRENELKKDNFYKLFIINLKNKENKSLQDLFDKKKNYILGKIKETNPKMNISRDNSSSGISNKIKKYLNDIYEKIPESKIKGGGRNKIKKRKTVKNKNKNKKGGNKKTIKKYQNKILKNNSRKKFSK
jgi:hypothetical protein